MGGLWLGNRGWNGGWALDMHTVSSAALPDGRFDTKRTHLGEMLYQLKYLDNRSMVVPIAEAAAAFLKTRWILGSLAGVVPVPPSAVRTFQPVEELALRIGELTNLRVELGYLQKLKATDPLKGVDDPTRRKEQLAGAFAVSDDRFANRAVLLFDDLYRSGETFRAVAETLYKHGKVAKVYVLTITKTRVKR